MARRVGAWLVGARGTVATTVAVGARAIARRLVGRTGLVTELPELSPLSLIGIDQLVFGGWEIQRGQLAGKAEELSRLEGFIPPALLSPLRADLVGVEKEIKPGVAVNNGRAVSRLADPALVENRETLADMVSRLRSDLEAFRRRQRLDDVIVVNVASTEAPIRLGREHGSLDSFRRLIERDEWKRLTPSLLYAYAALDHGLPYLNFTPSPGSSIPALRELATKHHVPHYGNDGKTGETLVKTVLAPMFLHRNLQVLSWEGHNILGGLDGKVLGDPRHKRLKLRSKERVLERVLGYRPHSGVSIEYVPSLGNWKTAWDFVHFKGFLEAKMSLQFIWQGCDAVLAAPLVLDLVRLTEFAHRMGEAGLMSHLACFFKDPIGVKEHSFESQWAMLLEYMERHRRSECGG